MANTSRLAAQSTKALAKLVKKALEDLKKSSDKTVSAKKNIKNAEKLNRKYVRSSCRRRHNWGSS